MTSGPPRLGVYIHWPYCARIGPYCDFNVARDRGGDEPAALARVRGGLEEVGAHVDIEAVRAELPGLMTIEEYLRRRGFDKKELPPAGWMMCAVM